MKVLKKVEILYSKAFRIINKKNIAIILCLPMLISFVNNSEYTISLMCS